MQRLPKWTLINQPPVLYDFESVTSLQQTARVYAAMQEMIREYNAFADQLNKEMDEFVGSGETEISNFKQTIESRIRCKFEAMDTAFAKLKTELISSSVPYTVRFDEQTLTEEQKEQARKNIGLDNTATFSNLLKELFTAAVYTSDQSKNVEMIKTLLDNKSIARHSVTNEFVFVASDNPDNSVINGNPYIATVYAVDGYLLDAVNVTMSGVDITDAVYNGNGKITIPAVTGDIVITATAYEEPNKLLTVGIGYTTKDDAPVLYENDMQKALYYVAGGQYPMVTYTDKNFTALSDLEVYPVQKNNAESVTIICEGYVPSVVELAYKDGAWAKTASSGWLPLNGSTYNFASSETEAFLVVFRNNNYTNITDANMADNITITMN